MSLLERIADGYGNPLLTTTDICSVLLMTLLLCIYVFIVYSLVSHRSFYDRSFNICIAVLPLFISTIVLCLQSNLVITLGTIGALAILRFRTAVKDPVDMLYLLWAVHIGIVCGCRLYEVGVLTSVLVTIVLLVMENASFVKRPYLMAFHCDDGQEEQPFALLKESKLVKNFRVKSRNMTKSGTDYVLELSVQDPDALLSELKKAGIEKCSLLEYDSDDLI